MSDFLTVAAKHGAMDSVNLLLSMNAKQSVEAPALTEAIKTRNQPLVDVIIQSMVKQQMENDNRSFVCGKLFPDVIKYNMVEAAQAIIENRWHKPTAKDLDLAKSVDNDVYKYLNDRQSAALSLHDDDGDLDLRLSMEILWTTGEMKIWKKKKIGDSTFFMEYFMGYSVFGFLALLCHIFILRNYGRFLVLSRLWKTYVHD